MTDFITRDPAPGAASAPLVLTGDWILADARAIEEAIRALPSSDTQQPVQADIARLDTAGALLISDLVAKVGQPVDQIAGLQDWQRDLLQLVAQTGEVKQAQQEWVGPLESLFTTVGAASVSAWHTTLDLLRFIGETVVTLGRMISHPQHIRVASIVRHVRETGLNAVPIVGLIAFLISVVLAYQGANQLQRFGAQIFTINMVAVSVLREMGVLLTAIMVAGRSGSAFTAEIGMMKVNEEVDAMRIIGVSPFEFLVMPRLLALVISLPLLTFIADMMGLLGGGLISETLLGIGFEHYMERINTAVKMKDFWVGIVKAPVFAFFIAIVGCMRGMQVTGSAESVGRLTTISVVQSIFLVLLLDALFSIFFTKLGI